MPLTEAQSAVFDKVRRGGFSGYFVRYESPEERPAFQLERAGLVVVMRLLPAGVVYGVNGPRG